MYTEKLSAAAVNEKGDCPQNGKFCKKDNKVVFCQYIGLVLWRKMG